MTVLAAHQINLCPWLPFFQKMEQADIFVLLKKPQFEKGGYINRFQHNERWNTLSVNKGLQPIEQKKYVNYKKDWDKILTHHPKLDVFSRLICEWLYLTNTEIIIAAKRMLAIDTPIVLDVPTQNTSTMRLIELCMLHKADTYLSGIGGRKYLDLDMFKRFEIKVIFQDESKLDKRSLLEILQ